MAPAPRIVDAGDADLVDWTPPSDAAALDRLLYRAELDVDALFTTLPPITTGAYAGLRLDPTGLLPYELDALKLAIVDQARHRLEHGETARGRRVSAESGPDFSVTYADAGGSGRYSPELPVLLGPLARFRRRGALAGGNRYGRRAETYPGA